MGDVVERFMLNPMNSGGGNKISLKFDTLNTLDNRGLLFLIVMALFYIPFTILFTPAMIEIFNRDRLFATEGREIDANILNCVMVSPSRGGAHPEVTYSYQVGGVAYEGTTAIRYKGGCENFPVGTSLLAIYLSSDPQESEIIGAVPAWHWILVYILLVCTMIFCICAGVVLVSGIIKFFLDKWRFWRLKRYGKRFDGEVVEAKGKLNLTANRYHVTIKYRFETPDGLTFIRKQTHRRDDLRTKPLPAAGTPVTVIYADNDACVML